MQFFDEIMKKLSKIQLYVAQKKSTTSDMGFPNKYTHLCVSDGSLVLLSFIWFAIIWQSECLSPPYELSTYHSLKSGSHLLHLHLKLIQFINYKQFLQLAASSRFDRPEQTPMKYLVHRMLFISQLLIWHATCCNSISSPSHLTINQPSAFRFVQSVTRWNELGRRKVNCC